MKVLVTGAHGFLGQHIVEALARQSHEVLLISREITATALESNIAEADAIIHLAGVNRPEHESEFERGNVGFTSEIAKALIRTKTKAKVLFSSSTQAALANPYGLSKLEAESKLKELSRINGNPVGIFRLTNVFGKWSRPNYNSVVSTFAHNIANDIPIQMSDPNLQLHLIYIDDVVQAFLQILDEDFAGVKFLSVDPVYEITLQDLADAFNSFKQMRETLRVPDFAEQITKNLYATYCSWLVGSGREYGLKIMSDERGSLAEFVKSPHIGQIFVSRTKPGITRGNHYHHTKPEKFLVVEGEATIHLRNILTNEIQQHNVRGEDYRVVDMTPGWTHSITNTGSTTLITIFWSGEQFDPQNPDTISLKVLAD